MRRAWVVLLVIVMTACGGESLINRSEEIPGGVWAFEDEQAFEVEVQDTLTPYNFYILVRHGGNYAFQNLIVTVKTYFPNNTFLTDTIDCPLADRAGGWYGSGLGDLLDNKVMFKRNVQMPEPGSYRFEIQHAMRSDTIHEIYDIGIAIEAATE